MASIPVTLDFAISGARVQHSCGWALTHLSVVLIIPDTELFFGGIMSRADDLHAYLNQVRQRANVDECTTLMAGFFNRLELTNWQIESMDVSEVSVDFSIIREGDDQVVRFSYNGKNWRYNSVVISDAEVCELLGIPLLYFQGWIDTAEFVRGQCVKIYERRVKLDDWQKRVLAWTSQVSAHKRRWGRLTSKTIAKLRKQVRMLQAREYCSIKVGDEYPPIPLPMAVAQNITGSILPSSSGVYFVWSGSELVYVGQSINLCRRARLGHENIVLGDYLSWLEFPPSELNFAEAYYIGLGRPSRNFGKGVGSLDANVRSS